MWILQQVVTVLSLVSFLEAKNPPPTANPECDSMNAAARHMKNSLKLVLKKDAQCNPNQHCTGVKCSWSNGGLLEVDLHHCQDPVNYHVFFKYPDVGITKNITLKQGDDTTLYQHQLITIKLKVTKLERTNDVVTSSLVLETCAVFGCLPQRLMDNQKFCVQMQNCSGFNATAHQYTPCGYKPTSPHTKQPTSVSTGPHTEHPTSASTGPHTKHPTSASTGPHTKHPTRASTGTTNASTGPHTKHPTSASTGPHTKHPISTTNASTGLHTKQPISASAGPHTKQPTSAPTVSPSGGTILNRKGGDGDNKKGGWSTAAIIGICAAAVVAILVIVGVVVYWKKYGYRSRLRAAYYNDISMEEPLYNDFGPEFA